MGDRTNVTLTVLASQKGKAEALFDGELPQTDYENGILWEFNFDEVNYGNLPFLKELKDNGIAYNSHWMDGGEYNEGTTSVRFTEEGKLVEKSVYAKNVNPDLESLVKLMDNPGALVYFIKWHQERVTPLPWDKQEEYGKLYQMMNLLVPA